MFGVDDSLLKNLATLQQQILAFMTATESALARLETQIDAIELMIKEINAHV